MSTVQMQQKIKLPSSFQRLLSQRTRLQSVTSISSAEKKSSLTQEGPHVRIPGTVETITEQNGSRQLELHLQNPQKFMFTT